MDKKLIWMIKSASVSPTRKNLEELSSRKDLFDESTIDFESEYYKEAKKNYDIAQKEGYSIVTYIDKLYPEKLKHISKPPAVLFVDGDATILADTVFTGIVGARKSDMYGTRMAETIALEIGQTGAGIISGGARGIDSASHRGALRSKAPTVAVLGCGLDVCYPPENKKLFREIASSGGAVVSEFPFGTPANAYNFPQRNRIIAALSTALVVVRAAYKSGSLITASRALEMGVSVFAVPGNIDDNLSSGTNALIRDGANILLSPMDVIDELIALEPDFFVREKERAELRESEEKIIIEEKPKKPQNLSSYEEEIVSIIESGAVFQSQIEEKISFEPQRLTALLGMMEIKGIIRKGPDKKYEITRRGC